MNFHELLCSRRSVRAYTPEPVSRATIESLLLSAVQAPSAMNRQPWRFAVVQDRSVLKRYSDAAKSRLLATQSGDAKSRRYASLLHSESFNIFYDAGTLIAGADAHDAYSDADCWLAAQNLMLAAHADGLGTCCIGFALPLLNTEAVKAELGFPASGSIVAALIVGRPALVAPPVPRNAPRVSAWLGGAEPR
jgi:nitroreductase